MLCNIYHCSYVVIRTTHKYIGLAYYCKMLLTKSVAQAIILVIVIFKEKEISL